VCFDGFYGDFLAFLSKKKMDEEVSNLHMHVWDGVASAVMAMFVDVC
jgi:hypothetical protein